MSVLMDKLTRKKKQEPKEDEGFSSSPIQIAPPDSSSHKPWITFALIFSLVAFGVSAYLFFVFQQSASERQALAKSFGEAKQTLTLMEGQVADFQLKINEFSEGFSAVEVKVDKLPKDIEGLRGKLNELTSLNQAQQENLRSMNQLLGRFKGNSRYSSPEAEKELGSRDTRYSGTASSTTSTEGA